MAATKDAYLRAFIDQLGDEKDMTAREEDSHVVFPSIATPTEIPRQSLAAIEVAKEPVLGCFLTKSLMDVFKDMVAQRCRRCTRLDDIPVDFEPTTDPVTNARCTQQLKDLIADGRRFHSSNCVYSNNLGLKVYLPRRVNFKTDLCEEFFIPDTDPRLRLRGQLGLRAKTFIEQYTVLGIYRGLFLQRFVTDNNLARNPRRGWRGTVQEWEYEIRRYMLEADFQLTNPATGKKETIMLDVSPYGYNSPGGLINDPRIVSAERHQMDPFLRGEKIRFSTDDVAPSSVVAPANTTVQSAHIFGFPFTVVLTTLPLLGGQELLYNYGPELFLQPGHFPTPNKFRMTYHT